MNGKFRSADYRESDSVFTAEPDEHSTLHVNPFESGEKVYVEMTLPKRSSLINMYLSRTQAKALVEQLQDFLAPDAPDRQGFRGVPANTLIPGGTVIYGTDEGGRFKFGLVQGGGYIANLADTYSNNTYWVK